MTISLAANEMHNKEVSMTSQVKTFVGCILFITLEVYLPGNPLSTSQNALKFSNSKSSGTSSENVRSAMVVTVIIIFNCLFSSSRY